MIRPISQISNSTAVQVFRPLGSFEEVEPLLALCRAGKLYEVEQWIHEGKPIQFPPPSDRKRQRVDTALQLSASSGFYSLAALLLANGYDPNGDYYECLFPAVRSKNRDMLALLLKSGANPNSVEFENVLETYDSWIMDRFVEAGVDPCRENGLAKAFTAHKARPILGFVKRHRDRFFGFQRQVDIALHYFCSKEDAKGVALAMWLGANPHAEVPSCPYHEGPDSDFSSTAFVSALYCRKEEILVSLLKRPIPKERLDSLLFAASYRGNEKVVERLLDDGASPNSLSEEGLHVLYGFIGGLCWKFGNRTSEEIEQGLRGIEILLKAGSKWHPENQHIKWVRRHLANGESRTIFRLVGLFRKYGAFDEATLHELTRTPAVQRVLNGVSKSDRDRWAFSHASSTMYPASPQSGNSVGYSKRFSSRWR